MTFETTDALYRAEIDKFSAYVSIKESDRLIEGFFASGQLIRNLNFEEGRINNADLLVGLTGSIGRREANTAYSDYDFAVITRDRDARDKAISHLVELNPKARFERRELFTIGVVQSAETDPIREIYYPSIHPDKILEPSALKERVWLLTEFTPLANAEIYTEIQHTLANHYQVFTDPGMYAKPEKLLDDLVAYQNAFVTSLEKTQDLEENEQPGLTTHAKTIILRKFAHLFNLLAVVRMVCRKDHITSCPEGPARDSVVFADLRAPTLIRIGYWFSDEFHFEKPMRRFDSEKEMSASSEVFKRYIKFLSKNSPGSRGRVILKLCEPLQTERGLVRRLFKRTSVELIENYNVGLKRIWTGSLRLHLAGLSSGASRALRREPEFDNIIELSQRVLWPLYALANLLFITFEIAGEWGYFEDETYPYSGRKAATTRLLHETKKMLDAANEAAKPG